MRDEIRRYVEAGLGVLSPSGARDAARSLLQGEGRERVSRAAQDLLEWSARSRERITELIQREVRRQLKGVGLATRDDLDALRKRVRDLEKAAASAGGGAGAPRKPAAKRSPAKKSPAGRSPARRSPARKPAASS